MRIEFGEGWIRHSSGEFFVAHPITDAREIGGRIIVLFDYVAFPQGEAARNLFAYQYCRAGVDNG